MPKQDTNSINPNCSGGGNGFRIVALVNGFSAKGKAMSGGDRRAIEVLRRLIPAGVRVMVVTTRSGALTFREYLAASYVTPPLLTYFDRMGAIISYSVRSIVVAFFFRPQRGDVLYCTSSLLPDVLPAFVLRKIRSDTNWVQIVHHLVPHYSTRPGSRIRNVLAYLAHQMSMRLIRTSADLVITVNPIVRDKLLDSGFPETLVVLNSNGVDASFMNKIRPQSKIIDGVFLGRIHASKGIDDLIAAWVMVNRRRPGSKLIIIGDINQKAMQRLTSEIAKKNLDIEVTGYLQPEAAFSILKSSCVFVFPSYEEGFGIAILEAMACGVPVVAYDLPAYRQIFERKLVRVPVGNVEELANQVIRLLENPDARSSLAIEGMKLAVKYDWQEIANKELLLMQSLIFQRRAGA